MNKNMQTDSEAKLVIDCITKYWDSLPDSVKNLVISLLVGGFFLDKATCFLKELSAFIKNHPEVEECLSKLIAKFQCSNNTVNALGCSEINNVAEVPAS